MGHESGSTTAAASLSPFSELGRAVKRSRAERPCGREVPAVVGSVRRSIYDFRFLSTISQAGFRQVYRCDQVLLGGRTAHVAYTERSRGLTLGGRSVSAQPKDRRERESLRGRQVPAGWLGPTERSSF